MEEPLQSQTPQPPESCSSPGLAGKPCWNLDFKVAVLLVTLAGAVILLLLYKLLQMWHRLKLARAIHALEYNSFYHSATYTLPQLTPCQDITIKNGTIPEDISPIQTITAVTPPVVTPALPATLTP
ncbi:unnamed protein product [Menidia menidia]|uniref:(Atlantic silverside) hypothetical protein n=1 Tax=Menidia menidia TaxID=238744 RepID=A0A8S4AN85_9TELE|nr:unnamed protein product [Menidia menidia]